MIKHCKDKKIEETLITDLNIKTLAYVKKCKKQKSTRNIALTKHYLKQHKILAVPFDKGVGICLMKAETYNTKLDEIISLPQFQKILPTRKNEKNPILKEEERIIKMLETLKKQKKISDILFYKLKPIGSQPPRLYGLAKINKENVPVRPVLSMSGSAYHNIAKIVTDWLSVVPQCNINSSTKIISDQLSNIELHGNDEIISFDVVSLYTNVPVIEAINVCSDLLYSGDHKKPPVDKETFKELLTLCSYNVIMLTHDGLYRQVDGLAMGSSAAPMLANGWMSTFDPVLKDDAMLYSRYMNDILRNIRTDDIEETLVKFNSLHPALKASVEREENNSIAFLDMRILHAGNKLMSTWFTKPTDTGLIMNFYALAPLTYKRSVVSGMVYIIFRSCSSYKTLHESLQRAKIILERNQYPESFFNPIIKKTLDKCLQESVPQIEEDKGEEEEEEEKKMFLVEYRGKISDQFKEAITRLDMPCRVIFTLKKLKNVLLSLKPSVDKSLKSGVVYKILCPQCKSCYVGQTRRHLLTRIKEHGRPKAPVAVHMRSCQHVLTMDDVDILSSKAKLADQLMTLEALFIEQLFPQLNTEDEYRSRSLVIKF